MAKGKPYGNEFRKRVITEIENGMSRRKAADHFRLGASTAIEWMKRYKDTGSYEASKMGGDRSSKLAGYKAFFLAMIRQCDPTRREICLSLRIQNVYVCENTVGNYFKKHDISFKKNAGRH